MWFRLLLRTVPNDNTLNRENHCRANLMLKRMDFRLQPVAGKNRLKPNAIR